MNAFRLNGVREVWVASASKFGKSLGAAVALASEAPTRKSTLWRWVAPIYTQSKIGFRYFNRLLPGEPYVKFNHSDLTCTFQGVDSTVQFFHGQNPESLEGEAINGYVLDECSKMKPEVYSSAKTTTTVTQGPMLCISTPRGKNWFYQKCMEAKEHMEWSLKNNKVPQLVFISASAMENPHVPKSSIEEARRGLPDRLFQQYVMAEFVDDSDVFSGYRECLYTDFMQFDPHQRQKWIKEGSSEATVVIGVDWAKTKDWTVFTAVELGEVPRLIGFDRFQNIDYINAVKELVRFSRKFGEVQLINHDRTGVGVAIDDILAQTSLPYEGTVFTNDSKSHMVNTLVMAFQGQQIQIPQWDTLLRELDSFEVTTNQLGKMRYEAMLGSTDDIVCSLMLAYASAQEMGGSLEAKNLEELKTMDFKSLYDEIDDIEDEDRFGIPL